MKNVKIANLNVSLKRLFKLWLEITKPFHGLTPQQQSILALFLYHHYNLKNEITNEKILWKILFDYNTKMKIKEELNLQDQTLQNNLTQLRKKGIIKDNTIVSTYIPELDQDSNNFKIVFDLNIIK